MRLICGLGNPGIKYDNTRHNVGFAFLDFISGYADFNKKWNASIHEMKLSGETLLLMKPNTFMNSSGDAVLKFLNFYKIEKQEIIVVYDDVDLPLGKIRYRSCGSGGTHNGMKSVVKALGTQDFPRLRIGIESRGLYAPKEMNLGTFVLSPFLQEERAYLDMAMQEAWDILKKSLAQS